MSGHRRRSKKKVPEKEEATKPAAVEKKGLGSLIKEKLSS